MNIDSGIFDDETAIGVKSLGDSFTVLSVVAGFSEEGLHINDGNRKRSAEESADFQNSEHFVVLLS